MLDITFIFYPFDAENKEQQKSKEQRWKHIYNGSLHHYYGLQGLRCTYPSLPLISYNFLLLLFSYHTGPPPHLLAVPQTQKVYSCPQAFALVVSSNNALPLDKYLASYPTVLQILSSLVRTALSFLNLHYPLPQPLKYSLFPHLL